MFRPGERPDWIFYDTMTKNGIFLTVIAVVLLVIYGVYFSDWFRTVPIIIVPQARVGRVMNIGRPGDQPPASAVSFLFDRAYRLTCVKVLAAEDLATNKSPAVLWHLVSDPASNPIKAIFYGMPIKGMKLAQPSRRAQPLVPGVNYIIQVEAGKKMKGQTNFVALEAIRIGGA